eukprot:scaffold15815_cov207-Alexandrium_tamarense.AAC.2
MSSTPSPRAMVHNAQTSLRTGINNARSFVRRSKKADIVTGAAAGLNGREQVAFVSSFGLWIECVCWWGLSVGLDG